ncbi:MAG: leucine-rich repeat domain-containing protein, partial [Clostridiales bacterium]|nr:leucine-rich repeat domain-containing protein [Clostridiales bacterium]
LEYVLNIGSYAFARTGLEQATIGANAKYGEGVFFRSKLEHVTIGQNAVLGLGVFQNCEKLTTVNMPENGGVHFGIACFWGDTALVNIDLSKHDGEIEAYAFYGCTKLSAINLAEVKYIGEYAFADCRSLSKVELPKVIAIGERAFSFSESSAPRFTALNLPETATEIGDYAFAGNTYLTTVTILGPIDTIPEFAFAMCSSLTRVELPSTVKTIKYRAFYGCQRLANINLGGVETFEDDSFMIGGISQGMLLYSSALANIDLTSAKYVGNFAFAGAGVSCNITANNLEIVGDSAFLNGTSSIESFTAPRLAYIGIAAFQNNSELTEFVFSSDIAYVGTGAFYGCTKLECFFYMKDGAKAFDGEINGYAELVDGVLYTYMPNGDLMLSSIPSARTLSMFILKERTTVIDQYAANANKTIRNVVLSDELRSIGNFAFDSCTNLESVEFRSFTAPKLENNYVALSDDYDTEHQLVPGDPGYELVRGQIAVGYDDTLCYYNFLGLAGKYEPIKMILPANSGIIGYDSLIYELIFGKQSDAQTSNYVAMDENLSGFIVGAKEIYRIKTITLSDEQLVIDTISALEATTQKGTDYGYTAEEWKALVDAVYSARDTINAMKGVSSPAVETPNDGGLAGWAIALIVVCVVVIVAAGVVIALLMLKKRKGGNK